jgi:type III pantothenate kinase
MTGRSRPEILLAIDAGNTDTVLGLFKGNKLLDEWRMKSASARTPRLLRASVRSLALECGTKPEEIGGVVVSSVIPRLTRACAGMARAYLRREAVVISGSSDAGIRLLYDHPSRLGADRLCNAIAALELFGGPAIVIDFGTATTFDVLSARGEYLGGVIAPGIGTAAYALTRLTARLPDVEPAFPEEVIGKNTISGMQSGIMFGALDGMEGMVRRIRETVGVNARVIATGGYAPLVASRSRVITHVEPSLVLEGARLIYERVTRRNGKNS